MFRGSKFFAFPPIRRFCLSLLLLAGIFSAGRLPAFAQAKPSKDVTGEQVAESAIAVNGTREGMAQIRRNGEERGRITRYLPEGKVEEAQYIRRFIRGESLDKDKIRIDQKSPTTENALIYADSRTWGIISDAVYIPRQEASDEFMDIIWHSVDTLYRYKENGSTVTLVGTDKLMGVDLYVIDVTDKQQHRTRFYISQKSGRILMLEYEVTSGGSTPPQKFMRKFYDYRIVQGTLVPYRTVLLQDGKAVQEIHVMTVTYGLKIDAALFQNPEIQSAETPKP